MKLRARVHITDLNCKYPMSSNLYCKQLYLEGIELSVAFMDNDMQARGGYYLFSNFK